jgi:hypothetical protein
MSAPFKLIIGGAQSQEDAASELYADLQEVISNYDGPIVVVLGLLEIIRAGLVAEALEAD